MTANPPHQPTPRGRHVLLRRAVGGLAAGILAVGVLAGTAASSVPGLGGQRQGVVALAAAAGSSGGGVSIGRVGGSLASAPQSLDEIFALLERAERAAHESGRSITPAISQAAAELGMLLTTYLAQRDDVVPGLGPAEIFAADVDAVSDVPPLLDLTDQPAPEVGAAAGERREVTFDDVVVAAMRLAALLDSEGAYRVAASGTVGPAGTTPLTTMLRQAVERFGRSTDGFANGRIPADVLCALPFAPGHRLRCDAAAQLVALNAVYEEQFGRAIAMTDSYRTFESQVALRAAKPRLAAVPGSSMHGWGLAVDLGAPISTGTSPEYVWLRLHGPDYGWDNPSWARLDGSKPEPWHFEFFAAGPVPDRALSPQDVAGLHGAGGAGSVAPGPTTQRERPTTEPTSPPSGPPSTAGPSPSTGPATGPPAPTTPTTPKPTSPTPTTPVTPATDKPSPPADEATDGPNDKPTGEPSGDPTVQPTDPTDEPTDEPTPSTGQPSGPTDEPTDQPTGPTDEPTDPTDEPGGPTDPTDEPAQPSGPTDAPTDEPTPPTDQPTDVPAGAQPGEETDPAGDPTGAPPGETGDNPGCPPPVDQATDTPVAPDCAPAQPAAEPATESAGDPAGAPASSTSPDLATVPAASTATPRTRRPDGDPDATRRRP